MIEAQIGKPWEPNVDPQAPPGFVWKCQACGKEVFNIYSEVGGFDESCVLNAVLSRRDSGK